MNLTLIFLAAAQMAAISCGPPEEVHRMHGGAQARLAAPYLACLQSAKVAPGREQGKQAVLACRATRSGLLKRGAAQTRSSLSALLDRVDAAWIAAAWCATDVG